MTSMQEQLDAQSPWLTRGKYVLYFVNWVAFVGLTFYLLTRLRLNLLLLIEVLDINRWARSAVHNFSFVILGLVGLSMVIIVENHLRTAVPKGLLARRTATTVGSVLILLVASLALHRLLLYLVMT